MISSTFRGIPTKEREGERKGEKVCSKSGPTLLSSTSTLPLHSRNGNLYRYLHTRVEKQRASLTVIFVIFINQIINYNELDQSNKICDIMGM